MPTTTLPQQLTELRRELATRQRVYPDWVRTHKLTQATADHRTATLADTITLLEQLAALLPTAVPPAATQGQLFASGQVAHTLAPGPYADR